MSDTNLKTKEKPINESFSHEMNRTIDKLIIDNGLPMSIHILRSMLQLAYLAGSENESRRAHKKITRIIDSFAKEIEKDEL